MKVSLPEGYHEITIEQYQNVWKAYEKSMNAHESVRLAIECLGGLEPGSLKNAQWHEIEKAGELLAWFIADPDASTMKQPLQQKVMLDNRWYGFIPNWTTLTVGEFADLDTYCNQGMFDNLHVIMSILYRPIVLERHDSYEIETYVPSKERKAKMLNLKMDVAIGALVFFCNIEKELAITMQHSLSKKEQTKKLKQFTVNGAGSQLSTN